MDFEKVIADIEKMKLNLYDLAIYDNGKAYFHTFGKCNRCNDSYSVAKAYTMTAVGLMWADGKLDLTERFTEMFSEHLPESYDKRWNQMTVEHALIHHTGMSQGAMDIDVEDVNDYGTEDYLRHLFSLPLEKTPGEDYCYTDAAYYLLSRAAGKAAGENIDTLLYNRVLKYMGMREIAWSRDPENHPIGATGLYISAEDMVKLAILYMNNGIYAGKQLIPEKWIQRVLEKEYEFHLQKAGKMYMKGGMYGQGLGFIPSEGIAVAWHGCIEGGNSKTSLVPYFEALRA